jgi:spermidine synthase
MALPWKVIDQFIAEDEGKLELRQRGKRDFIITLGTQILMNSMAQRSEIALGNFGASPLKNHPAPRVLLGGLGMGITLRAVLDSLAKTATVVVWELNPKICQWCQGPLYDLTKGAVADPRVCVTVGDVVQGIGNASKNTGHTRFDAIILDLYRGPHSRTDKREDPLYGSRALARVHKALKRPGKGGYSHAVFLATKNTS